MFNKIMIYHRNLMQKVNNFNKHNKKYRNYNKIITKLTVNYNNYYNMNK